MPNQRLYGVVDLPLDEAELCKFIEAMKQSGTVSIHELHRALPIDTKGGEDIAAIVLRLEAAGVSVEIKSSLFSPKHSYWLTPLGIAKAQSSPTIISTASYSRVSSDFQGRDQLSHPLSRTIEE